MSEIVDQSLQKIAKGSGVILFGTAIGMLLGFAGRILIARFFTQSEYGVFSLAFLILSVFVTISTLGLEDGAARQIAFYRGERDEAKVQGVIRSSI